ncbi:hypothetical protein ACFSC4_28055 [Deinococcus malanensis]|uniref:hypothetical protein n=1 Tax=Deinococcus malanensis TaxID=1706855 RepID=UPI00362ACDA8
MDAGARGVRGRAPGLRRGHHAERGVQRPLGQPAGGDTRHEDHRFEWTRAQFQEWARRVASEFGYAVTFTDVGEADERLGPPTQMAVFRREAS